jgi:type II secretory pathway pseudopilin PulG
MLRRDRRLGFTLIEALVVMIVGTTLLAVSAAGIGKVFRNSEIAAEASNILLMQDRVRDLRNGKENYKGLSNALAISNNVVPPNMARKGNKIFNAWNGEVVFSAVDGGTHYLIDYYKVPIEACQRLVMRMGQSGWERIQINSADIPAGISLADLGKRCDAGGSNGNKVGFVGGAR